MTGSIGGSCPGSVRTLLTLFDRLRDCCDARLARDPLASDFHVTVDGCAAPMPRARACELSRPLLPLVCTVRRGAAEGGDGKGDSAGGVKGPGMGGLDGGGGGGGLYTVAWR